MKKYHDPEYDRIVDETEVRKQYEWFAQQTWFNKSFEEFAEDNFTEIKEEKDMARFEINGTIYEANDKGTYFYKSTGDVDKKGNPIMKRVSKAVYEQAFEEYTQQAQDNADAWETEMDEAKANAQAEQDRKDAETEANFNKKHGGVEIPKSALEANKKYIEKTEKKAKKPAKRSKDVAFRHQDITLTQKQVDFIHAAQQTSFYEHGVESTLWIDVLTDEIGGEFAGKPMTVGAMISTLKEKELVFVAVEKVNGKKSKYFGFTELGQQILEELG
jgi:hypothetical protein